jgi:ketosteroid isomerase-like protein
MPTPTDIATAYFDAWRTKDLDRYESLLAPDAVFDGPLGHAEGAADCRAGMERLAGITTDVVVQKMAADGDDVITWFELHTTLAPPTPVANWSRVKDGRIARIRVTFDPRAMLAG